MQKTGTLKINRNRFFWDASFVLWMLTDYSFSHSVLSILMFVFFVGMTFMVMFNRGFRFPRMGGILIWYSLFILFACLNIVTGHSISRATSRSLISTLLLNFVFFCSFSYYLRYTRTERFKKILTFSAVAASMLMLLLNFAARRSFVLRDGGLNGNSLAVCDAIVMCWILCDGKFRDRACRNTLTLVFLLAFCLSAGTRKAFFALAIGITLFVLLNNPTKLMRNILFISVIILIGYWSITNIPFLFNLIGYRMVTLFELFSGGRGAASERTRMAFVRLGLLYFRENKFWGYGINCFKLISGSANTYSHNNYVELLFSLGIPGTLLYYSMYLSILRDGVRRLFVGRTRRIVLGVSLTVVILFTDVAMVSYYSKTTFMFIALLYHLVSDNRKNGQGDYSA